MKVMIVTNGRVFRIKEKGLFFWGFYKNKCQLLDNIVEFPTFKEAHQYLIKEYGSQFKLINHSIWKVVPITDKLICDTL